MVRPDSTHSTHLVVPLHARALSRHTFDGCYGYFSALTCSNYERSKGSDLKSEQDQLRRITHLFAGASKKGRVSDATPASCHPLGDNCAERTLR